MPATARSGLLVKYTRSFGQMTAAFNRLRRVWRALPRLRRVHGVATGCRWAVLTVIPSEARDLHVLA